MTAPPPSEPTGPPHSSVPAGTRPRPTHRLATALPILGFLTISVGAVVAIAGVVAFFAWPRDRDTHPLDSLAIPSGWTKNGLTAAPDPRDVDRQVPEGPRLRGEYVKELFTTPEGALAIAKFEEPQVASEPKAIVVGGKAAVAVEFIVTRDGERIHQLYVTVRQSESEAIAYVLEAPEDQWNAGAGATLRAVAGL